MADGDKDIPRWIGTAADATRRDPVELRTSIDDLIDTGWDASEIVRELGVPLAQRRSLQLYVKTNRPRATYELLANTCLSLLRADMEIAPKYRRGLLQVAERAAAEDTAPKERRQAMSLLGAVRVKAVKVAVEQLTREREREPQEREKQDPKAALGEMLADLRRDGGADGTDG